MLDEQTIKTAVIDRLFSTGSLDDAVLINELVFANWSRRADLAVANGNLCAFEIKSDFDSLRRLDGQVDSYLERFDKVTLVVSSKFVNDVIRMTPKKVAIWEAYQENDEVQLKIIRRGRTVEIKDKDILLDYILKDELYRFLQTKGVIARALQSKSALVRLALDQSIVELRALVLRSLKARYKVSFDRFGLARTGVTRPEHLTALRKNIPNVAKFSVISKNIDIDNTPQRVMIDLSRLFLNGVVPKEIPSFIVTRGNSNRRNRKKATSISPTPDPRHLALDNIPPYSESDA